MDVSLSKFWEMVKDREAQHAAVYGVAKNWTWLSDWTTADWIKRITCRNVDGPYPTSWRHKRAKRLREKELLLPDCLPAGALLFFSASELKVKYWLFKPASFRLEQRDQFSWVFSLPTAAPGASHSSKLGESIPYEKISFHINFIGTVSLENPNMALLLAFSDLAPLPLEHDTWSLHLQFTTISSPEPCILCHHSLERYSPLSHKNKNDSDNG